LILEDCKVPKENVLGEVGKGYKTSIETLNEGRIGIGAQMIGLARGALECALRYTTERQQFGKSINQFQGLQFQLAEMAYRPRSGAPDGLQRGADERCRPEFCEGSSDGQALFVARC
jgi:alkylation response protein AidB-like acyl-CoA dehydrogenase